MSVFRLFQLGGLIAALSVVPVPVVAEDCEGNKETVGTVVGAVLGGVVGSRFGKGSGRTAATVVGAVAGGYAGNRYGEYLDCEDQKQQSLAAHDALENQRSGEPSSWKNPDSGRSGSITPVKTWQREDGQYCRDYTQSIVIDGKVEEATGTACREDDGLWRIVSNEPRQAAPDYSESQRQERF